MSPPRFAVIVLTLNAGELWDRWVQGMRMQSFVPEVVLVVDSSSTDGTAERAEAEGYRVHRIERADFNHGRTRQLAADLLSEAEVLVYLTQDAFLADPDALRELVTVFDNEKVGVAYGRQLPRPGSGPFEAHARLFNYPDQSLIRSQADIPELGMKVVFTSNSYCAYRASALQEVGGFPVSVIVSEDMYVAAKMMSAGWSVAYCATSRVIHSHCYTPWQELQRYFDVGVFNAREPWIMQVYGAPTGEGLRFMLSELRYLGVKKFYRIPEALLRTLLKLVGFRLGLIESSLPYWLKQRLSLQKWFWR